MDIKIHRTKIIRDNRLKAVFSFVFDDCFAVHDVKLLEIDGRVFLAMPSRQQNGLWRDIAHPIGAEMRAEMEHLAIAAYEDLLIKEKSALPHIEIE